MSAPLEVAREAWGDPVPEWIEALALACQASSQNQVARRLGRSAGLVSQVLRRKYLGDMRGVEEAVRGALMSETVACPALGAIPADQCQAWRRRSKRFANANALTVRMFRACSRCPRARALAQGEAPAEAPLAEGGS